MEDWINVSPTSGTGSAEVTVTVDANETIEERSGTITFKSSDGSIVKTVTVTQSGAEEILDVDTETIDVGAEGGTSTINVTSNGSWSIE